MDNPAFKNDLNQQNNNIRDEKVCHNIKQGFSVHVYLTFYFVDKGTSHFTNKQECRGIQKNNVKMIKRIKNYFSP
jgi:hypothetical protein